MISFPPCKINLGLQIVSKRNDGFHNIETCFYPVTRQDILEIIPANEFAFSQSGIKVPGLQEENLCVKAFHLLKKDFGIENVKIHLHKIIPMGAGLGGGSSDAAFALRLFNGIFDLKIPTNQLKNYASQLGSDCAFFIEDQPMIGKGRGDILSTTSVSLKSCYLVLVKPNVHVSTAQAYADISPRQPEISVEEVLRLPLKEWRTKLINDFEKSIFEKHPVISQVKDKLYMLGADYACMSGSGASVFGIFEKPIDLKKDFPEMDYWCGELK